MGTGGLAEDSWGTGWTWNKVLWQTLVTCLCDGCGRLALPRGGKSQIFQEGDALFVSSQTHWDGTNLIFKSRRNVIFRGGRWGRHLFRASEEPASLQMPFHSTVILAGTSGAEGGIVTALALRHVLLSHPVCLYFPCK